MKKHFDFHAQFEQYDKKLVLKICINIMNLNKENYFDFHAWNDDHRNI